MKGKRVAKKKRNTSNIVLVIIGIFALTFIVSMEVIFILKGSVPDTLIQYTLGAGGVEVLLLAAIKISKVIKGEKDNAEREDSNGEDYSEIDIS